MISGFFNSISYHQLPFYKNCCNKFHFSLDKWKIFHYYFSIITYQTISNYITRRLKYKIFIIFAFKSNIFNITFAFFNFKTTNTQGNGETQREILVILLKKYLYVVKSHINWGLSSVPRKEKHWNINRYESIYS